MSRTLWPLTIALLFFLVSQLGAQDANLIEITGRLQYADKSPIVDMQVMVMEAKSKDGKVMVTLKTGANGLLSNPTATTDKAGRFVIKADRQFWAGTGHFTLRGGFLPGTTTDAGILLGPEDAPMLLVVDKKTKRVDVGDVTVKQP